MKRLIIFATLLLLVGGQDHIESEECRMSGHNKGEMHMGKNFMDSLMKTCLNVTYPPEMMEVGKDCFRKVIMNTTMIQDVTKGIFPDKNKVMELIKSLASCQYGLQSPQTNIDAEYIIRTIKLDQWKGDQKDINMVRDKIRECMNRAQGTTSLEKLLSLNKCMVNSLIDYCSTQGEDPGMTLVIFSKLLTINDVSKCASVKVPQDAINTRKQCMDEAKRSMNTTLPLEIEQQRNQMKKMKLIGKYFMKEYLVKSMECCLEKKGLFDSATKSLNIRAIADYVKGFDGWNNIPQERDTVYNAIIECGKAFDGVSNYSMGAFDRDDSSSEEDMEENRIKEMMKDKLEFEKCFSPKFAQSCGINNELANFLYPLLDSQFMSDVFKAFMDIGGKEVSNMIDVLKQKF